MLSQDRDFVSIDPGVDYFAWACFRGGALESCALEADRGPRAWAMSQTWPELGVIEMPARRYRESIRERDVFELARAAGELGGLFPYRVYVTPADWKGQLSKKIDQDRTLKALTPAELALLPKQKSALKHVLDAIGIGLKRLGRR